MNASSMPDAAGFEAELLRINSAQLYLVHSEESLLIKNGDFVVRITKQSDSPLAVVLASVGDIYWPLGKDSPILRVGSRHFACVLSDLIYGLVLPESTPSQVLAHLERLLTQYSTFEVRQERDPSGGTTPVEHEKPAHFFWTALAPEILRSGLQLLAAMCDAGGSALASSILKKRRVSVSSSSEHRENSGECDGLFDVTPQSMKRVHQAHRISAVSKLLSRTLLRGALSASNHVADVYATQTGSPLDVRASVDRVAVACVDAISKVVDAVESSGKSIQTGDSARNFSFSSSSNDLSKADDLRADESAKRKGSRSASSNSSWTLNKTGLSLLFHVTTASAKLYSSYRRSNTQPSSEKDCMRLSGGLGNSRYSGFDAKSSPSQSNMMHSDQMCYSPESQNGFPSPDGPRTSLPELSLFPGSINYSPSLARHTKTQQFYSASTDLPPAPSVQQQLKPKPPAAMPDIGFSPFLTSNAYAEFLARTSEEGHVLENSSGIPAKNGSHLSRA